MDTRSVAKAFIADSMASYGKHFQSVHSKITLTYLLTKANLPLYTPENGFQGALNAKAAPFLSFSQVFSALINKLPERAPTKIRLHVLSINPHYVHGHIDDPPTLN